MPPLGCDRHGAESAGPPVRDPAKIIGADQCAKCHQPEVQQWMQTPHFATFETLHRLPRAKEIADKLGLQSIKRNDVCTQCHYTKQVEDGRERVVAGVSCESCHGGARDWVALHNDYGGPGVTKAAESAEHRAKRVADSVAKGMNNPHNIYLIARQCYDCHTVPNEKLVNVGGHLAGSQDFELVAWSQGMVRHNFVRGGGTTNATLQPGRAARDVRRRRDDRSRVQPAGDGDGDRQVDVRRDEREAGGADEEEAARDSEARQRSAD